MEERDPIIEKELQELPRHYYSFVHGTHVQLKKSQTYILLAHYNKIIYIFA